MKTSIGQSAISLLGFVLNPFATAGLFGYEDTSIRVCLSPFCIQIKLG